MVYHVCTSIILIRVDNTGEYAVSLFSDMAKIGVKHGIYDTANDLRPIQIYPPYTNLYTWQCSLLVVYNYSYVT